MEWDEDEIVVEITADVIELELIAEPEIVIEIGEGSGKAEWGFITGELADQTDLAAALDGKSDTGHTHDDRYYTESEIDAALAVINTALSGKSDTGHTHDDRYYTETEIDAALQVINTALDGKSDTGHDHDERYYTEQEIDGLTDIINYELSKKANISHTHDDRYYTESETDTKLSGKSDTGHTHDDRYYTESETDTALAGKSDTGHTHDDRYYTETETDTKLAGKSDTGHDHDDRYYTETETDTALAGKADSSHEHSAGDITSGTLPIERGGTNADNIVNARRNLGFAGMFCAEAVFAAECIEIPWNANLNTQTYCATGKYYVPTNAQTATITNCPTGGMAFQMLVFNLLDSETGPMVNPVWVSRTRIIMTYEGNIYVQLVDKNRTVFTYGAWRKITMA